MTLQTPSNLPMTLSSGFLQASGRTSQTLGTSWRDPSRRGVCVYSLVEAAKHSAPELGASRYFEPRKQSGYGVEGGLPGFLAYTSAQSVSFFN